MGFKNPNLTGVTEDNTENKKTGEGKEPCRIKVPEDSKKVFQDTFKGRIMRASELSNDISELFSAAFSDFAGCWIEPYSQGGGFDLKLYFNPAQNNGQGAMCAFEVDNGELGVGKTGYVYFVDFDRTHPRTRRCKVVVIGE